MDFDALMVELEDKLLPNTITGVVDTGDCYVVSVCAPDGFPLLQPPYQVSRNGEIGLYDIFDEQMKQKLENGRVLYTDYTPLKVKPVNPSEAQLAPHHADGSSGSGNWGHKGVPGQLGGSAPGGGIAHRTGSKETGYSSVAKEKAKAKASSSAGSPSTGGSAEKSVPASKTVTTTKPLKGSDFKSVGNGDFETSEKIADMHLTDTARKKIDEVTGRARKSIFRNYL